MRRLVYLADARADLAEIFHYIRSESGSSDIAYAYIEKIDEHCRHLAGLPGTLGTARPELRPDLRSVSHQAHVIFFRYVEERIEVVSVVSAHRDLARLFDT